MPPTPPPKQDKGLTPDSLVNQLFDMALAGNTSDPRGAARQVTDFLAASLFYSLTSQKQDVVVYLTEALILSAMSTVTDEAARKELLAHIGNTIANAPTSAQDAKAAKAPPAAQPSPVSPSGSTPEAKPTPPAVTAKPPASATAATPSPKPTVTTTKAPAAKSASAPKKQT